MMKRYLENLICACSDEKFGQDAIEHAVLTGAFKPTYKLAADTAAIFAPAESQSCPHCQCTGQPPDSLKCDDCGRNLPPRTRYDQFVETYQQVVRSNEAALFPGYAGLLEEINRPVPLAQAA